jgi:hypothetical protein
VAAPIHFSNPWVVDESRYRMALTVERTLADLDRVQARLVAELYNLSHYFLRGGRRRKPETDLETELDLVVHAVASSSSYLADEVATLSSEHMEPAREDIAAVVELVEYLRDVERQQAIGGTMPTLSTDASRLVEIIREDIEEEDEENGRKDGDDA